MKETTYLDPNFYVVSDIMNYTIRGEVVLKEAVDGTMLQKAVETAMKRFPYFCLRIVKQGEKLVAEANPLPHKVLHTDEKITLGTEEVNYHIAVVSYFGNSIYFNFSHSITDGAGRAPLTKSVLYYYLKAKYPQDDISSEGIYLADSPMFPDEEGTPMPKEEIMKAEPFWQRTAGDAFHLAQGGIVKDRGLNEYRFRVNEKEFMRLNKSNDSSPSVLATAMLAKIIWKLHPENKKDIVTGLGFNMRPGLKNKHSYLPLVTTLTLTCKDSMKDFDLSKICTCLRGMVILQSQPENVQYMYKNMIIGAEAINGIPTIEGKQAACAEALSMENSPTCFVSYVGRDQLAGVSPYVTAMYTSVDAVTEGCIVIEISSADGYFYFTFEQDFSTDVYYKEFTNMIEEYGVKVEHIDHGPVKAPAMALPV